MYSLEVFTVGWYNEYMYNNFFLLKLDKTYPSIILFMYFLCDLRTRCIILWVFAYNEGTNHIWSQCIHIWLNRKFCQPVWGLLYLPWCYRHIAVCLSKRITSRSNLHVVFFLYFCLECIFPPPPPPPSTHTYTHFLYLISYDNRSKFL